MAAIEKQTGTNLGGVKLLRLFSLAGATALSNGNKIPNAYSAVISDDITPGTVDEIYFMENTGNLEVDLPSSGNGFSATAKFTAFIPKTNAASLAAATEHAGRKTIALVTDENDNVRLLGNDTEDIAISLKETNMPGVNGYNITIAFVSRSPVPYFTGGLS